MKTCVDIDRAREMREGGATLAVIAERYGVSRERIRQLVGSPARVLTCRECGSPFESGRSGQRYCSGECRETAAKTDTCSCGAAKSTRSEQCYECHRGLLAAERAARHERLAALWADGLSMEEIAAALGTTKNALGGEMVRARAAGVDLPLRRAATPMEPVTKTQARNQLADAIRRGVIRRGSRCERCGDVALTDGHHTDYSKPLYVEWLCRPCHLQHHADEKEAA